MTIDKKHKTEQVSSPQKQIGRRFLVLVILALVLIIILIWLTLAVLEANDLEPLGEIVQLFP